jgi:hypothetical protein
MSQTTGTARAKSDVLVSLAGQLSDPQNREAYAELVSYLKSLSPDDELVKVAQLLGFLTLMGRELPDAIAKGQTELREMLLKAHTAFQKLVETNAGYHQELNARLNQLPDEIAAGVKPEAIVKVMSESFRQQIAQTGLQETQKRLSAAASELKATTTALDEAVKPVTRLYENLVTKVAAQVTSLRGQADQLAATAGALKKKNEELLDKFHGLQWWAYLAIIVCLLLGGSVLGAMWEKENTGDLIVGLQGQVAQLEQTIQTLVAAQTAAPVKQAKKK